MAKRMAAEGGRHGKRAAALALGLGLCGAVAVLAGAEGPAPVAATAEPPQKQEAAPPALSEADMAQLRAGLQAARAGDWQGVRAARAAVSHPLARRVLLWRLAGDVNAPVLFEESEEALRQLDGWSRRVTMRRKAEQAIFDVSRSAAERASFLQAEGGPLSGDGKAALALALQDLDRGGEALALARDAYRNANLSNRAEAALRARFGARFGSEDHAARANAALWRDDTATASELLPRLSGAQRRVAEARIALQRRSTRGLQALVDAAAQAAPDDPGLLYDRARYIRRAGRPEDALGVIARTDPAAAPAVAQAVLNEERRLFVNRALRAGQFQTAYRLAAEHRLERGVDLAEAEWLAGFVAFRFLRDHEKAAQHWKRLRDNVSTPVSLARAFYWLGRVAERQGDQAGAQTSFAEAAQYGFTYYGQLARERLGNPPLSFAAELQISDESRAAFEGRELVQALRLLAAAGDRADYEALAFGLDDQLTTPEEHAQLSAIARGLGYHKAALRSAKAGLSRGVVAGDAAYPLLELPASATGAGRVEPALTLAIVRQESEFDPAARSGANARGLMQVLNSTGALTARRIGVPYGGPNALYDPATNLTLGSAYLHSLVNQFDGSYILAIAAYNAGPSRSNEWIGFWGDPRTRGVDPVEWVELIPFEETRNYVQRVLENVQVYRHRLAGRPQPVRLTEDLRRGGV